MPRPIVYEVVPSDGGWVVRMAANSESASNDAEAWTEVELARELRKAI